MPVLKVDIDYPDEYIKKLWDDAEVFDVIAWGLNKKQRRMVSQQLSLFDIKKENCLQISLAEKR